MTLSRRTAKPMRIALFLLLIVGVFAPIYVKRAAGQESIKISGAQVVAQGLTAPPAEKSAWRVVEQEIPNPIDAVPSVRLQSSAGFLLADAIDVFVVDQRTKMRSILAPGEAQFIQTGANQTWASRDNKKGTAYTLELVDRDVVDVAPNGDVTYKSGSFTTKTGDYDLDLVRGELAAGERAAIKGSSYSTLILITDGSATITSSKADEPVRLNVGAAVALKGDLAIKTRGDKPATFVAAVLGDPVTGGEDVPTAVPTRKPTKEPKKDDSGAEPTRKPKASKTPTPNGKPSVNDGSSIRIAVRLCPRGMTYFALNPSQCVRADGDFSISLITPKGRTLTQKAASKNEPTFVRWSGLSAGEYILVVNDLPDGYLSYSLDGYICCNANIGYSISLGKGELQDGTLYLFHSAWGEGKPVAPTSVPATTPESTSPEPGVDTDGDGLSDQLELDTFGTSPFLIDSDGDTIPDGTEAFGLNGWLTAPAIPDTDGDGVDDNVEIANGTSPLDPSSS
jgi:hypothetical protein